MSTAAPARLTADDLLAMPDGKHYELVDGQLVELAMSAESSWIAGELFGLIRDVVKANRVAWLFPEGTGYQCFPDDPNKVRRPDTSLILRERMPEGPPGKGFVRSAPDLVVEVVSSNDLAWEVDDKVEDWLGAGVTFVWVVMPTSRTVTIHQPGADIRKLGHQDELTCEGLLAGFRCRVKDLFPQPAGQ